MPPIFAYLALPLLAAGFLFLAGFAAGYSLGRSQNSGPNREPELPRFRRN